MSNNNWAVFRQDFTGNEFMIEKNLSKQRAEELVAEFESHKHHQHYWASEFDDSKDFSEMLKLSLSAGSTLVMSIKILQNQNASIQQCAEAIADVRGIAFEEAVERVRASGVYLET